MESAVRADVAWKLSIVIWTIGACALYKLTGTHNSLEKVFDILGYFYIFAIYPIVFAMGRVLAFLGPHPAILFFHDAGFAETEGFPSDSPSAG